MKNIVFLCSSDSKGGLELNIVKLAHALSQRNFKITVYTIPGAWISNLAIEKGVSVKFIKKHKKYFDFLKAFQLSRLLKRDKADVMFVFHSRDQSIAAIAKSFYPQFKLIYQQHMQLGLNRKDFFHTQRYRKFDLWITPLNNLADEVRNMTNYDNSKIKVIPIGVDSYKFVQCTISKSEARNLLGLPLNVKLIGILGRIDRQKGQLTLIKSLEFISDSNLKLVIAGEPTLGEGHIYFNEIKSYVNQHKLNDRVILIPFIKNPEIFYKAIDIFGLGSFSETYGMVTIEAMLSNIPVVATSTGGTPEILNYGDFGYLYGPENELEFAEKVNNILSNPIEVKSKTDSAKSWALKNYSLDKECDMFEHLMNSI